MARTTNSEDIAIGAAVGAAAVILVPAVIALMIVLDALALWMLWGWFATPLGAPIITLAHAAGIALLAAALRPLRSRKEGPQDTELWIGIFAKPALLILLGWIVKTFFM